MCLVLGGASAAGIMANAFLQIVSIGLIIAVMLSGALPPVPRPARRLLILGSLWATLLVLQLIPLPPLLWEHLPGRLDALHAFRLADIRPGWQPVSLVPDATIAVFLSLLPPMAMILITLASTRSGRRIAVWTLAGVAVVSVLLGLCQKAGGALSPLYPYAITNAGSPVGFFANRNHLGTLLLCALPFIPAILLPSQGDARPWRNWAVAALILVLAGSAILTGSTAAILLLAPAAAGCWFVASDGRGRRLSRLGGGIVLALLVMAAFACAWNFPANGKSDVSQHRGVITSLTVRAALDFMPFGSGGGSFRQIYPAYENPEDASPEFINHAHDDYAEIALEYGAPGILLALGAVGLWGERMRVLWRSPRNGQCIARAGGVAVGIVLLHSLVDYPARTAAIAVLMAFAATLMATPSALVEEPPRRLRSRRARSGSLMVMIDDL